MESDTGELVNMWSGIISRKHTIEAIFASALTLQAYDWLSILPQEVEYIWRGSWNWSKALYLLTRYTPFATLTLLLRDLLAPNPSLKTCKRILRAAVWPSFLGLASAEAILMIRTYAVWKRDKRVGIGLALLFVLCQVTMGVISGIWVSAANPIQNPYPEIIRGCLLYNTTRTVFVGWVIITIEEGVDLALMIISSLKTYRECRSNLMTVIYRDGIRFYLYIFCATLANVLCTLLLPLEFSTIGSTIEVILHSILACRLMIGIREASHSLGRKTETFELSEVPRNSTLEFARRSLGESA